MTWISYNTILSEGARHESYNASRNELLAFCKMRSTIHQDYRIAIEEGGVRHRLLYQVPSLKAKLEKFLRRQNWIIVDDSPRNLDQAWSQHQKWPHSHTLSAIQDPAPAKLWDHKVNMIVSMASSTAKANLSSFWHLLTWIGFSNVCLWAEAKA